MCHLPAATFVFWPAICRRWPATTLVQSYIVLKRVRPRDIVILVILRADDDAARLIDAARDRFETNGDADISDGQTVVDAKWKPIISRVVAGLGDNLTTSRGGLCVQDHPADRAAVSCQRLREAHGRSAGRH